jgi:NAD-dependent SIR2 family protein deacetylase
MFYESTSLKPSISHDFFKLLSDMGILLRVYTQNIDGLEEIAGVPKKCIIEAHGSLQRAQCIKCHKILQSVSSSEELGMEPLKVIPLYQYIQSSLQRGKVPTCPRIVTTRKKSPPNSNNLTSGQKRTLDEACVVEDSPCTANYARVCGGVLKPGITFFGEKLNTRVGTTLAKDKQDVDLLLVMGTSLSVAPMSDVLGYFPQDISRILINKTMIQPRSKVQDLLFDTCLLGECDPIILQLVQRMKHIHQRDEKLHKNKTWGALLSSFCSHGYTEKSIMEGNPQCYAALSNHERRIRPIHLYNHPEERILLFPDCNRKIKDLPDTDAMNFFPDSQQVHESVYCNQCHVRVEGKGMKCSTCFDYDLCLSCYPQSHKDHFDGRHDFVLENIDIT